MKYLLISKCGEGCGIALRLQNEGNLVKTFIEDKNYKNVYDGLINKTRSLSYDNADVVIFDMTGFGELGDEIKKCGIPTFNGSSFADRLEHDRDFGKDLMDRCGIKTPKTYPFRDFGKAIKFLKGQKDKFYFKASGEAPCNLTYSDNAAELSVYLEFIRDKYGKEIKKFDLQESIDGIAISTELFCDGKTVQGLNRTVETKKFMNDNLGPSTGCSANLVWIPEEDFIYTEGIEKIIDVLIAYNYTGQIDLNATVNKSGVYGLEWTPRVGYDSFATFIELLEQDLGKFIYDIASGNCKEVKLSTNGFAFGLRLTIPPYPAEPQKGDLEKEVPNEGIPILSYEDYQDRLFWYEVMRQDGRLVHAGGTGVIACITSVSDDTEDFVGEDTEVLEIAEGLCIPNKQYRTDCGKELVEMYKEVEECQMKLMEQW